MVYTATGGVGTTCSGVSKAVVYFSYIPCLDYTTAMEKEKLGLFNFSPNHAINSSIYISLVCH